MSRGFRSDPERLLLCDSNARCSTARAIPESQFTNGLRCYYYRDTTAVLQNCEHYRQLLLPQWRKIVLCFTGPTHSPHTVAGLRCCSQKTRTVSDTEIPNWHAVRQDACSTVPPYTRSCHARTRVRKREPKKKTVLACGPSWRISRFHALLASTVQPWL